MPYVGINIGAVVRQDRRRLDADQVQFRAVHHQGRPLQVVAELLQDVPGRDFFRRFGAAGPYLRGGGDGGRAGIRGRRLRRRGLAGRRGLRVYLLKGTRIVSVLSHNKCAAGSGEFFVQQIGRLGLDLEQAIDRSFAGKVVPLASRCSVHCKSDITHKLNRHEATPEDILHTLHDSMADKVVALLEKGQRPVKRLLVVGGVAQNRALIAALRDKLPHTQFVVLPESPYFEAWGPRCSTRSGTGLRVTLTLPWRLRFGPCPAWRSTRTA